STASAGGRIGSPAGRRDHRDRRHLSGVGGQSGNHDDPHRVHRLPPVKVGLVASLGRPGGNATGVNFLVAELGSKQLGLLHELVPAAVRVGLLVNPRGPQTELATRDVAAAASAIGLQIDVVEASNSREIEAAFRTLVRNRAESLVVGPDPFFASRRLHLATLATRHAIPAVYNI